MNSTITYRILSELIALMGTILSRMSRLYKQETVTVDPIHKLMCHLGTNLKMLESSVSSKLQEASDNGENTK